MPVDPARLNAVGDFVLTDTRELRALANPVRLTLFDLVRHEGPITSTELARSTDLDRASVEGHLRELESLGLIDGEHTERSEARWTAGVRGVYFEIPEDPEGQRAARELSNVILTKYAALPVAWVSEEEPQLELEWARAAGFFSARVDLTVHELRGIQEGLERLLEPFTTRTIDDIPADAAAVRIMAYFMPEARPRPTSLETD